MENFKPGQRQCIAPTNAPCAAPVGVSGTPYLIHERDERAQPSNHQFLREVEVGIGAEEGVVRSDAVRRFLPDSNEPTMNMMPSRAHYKPPATTREIKGLRYISPGTFPPARQGQVFGVSGFTRLEK